MHCPYDKLDVAHKPHGTSLKDAGTWVTAGRTESEFLCSRCFMEHSLGRQMVVVKGLGKPVQGHPGNDDSWGTPRGQS